MSHSRFSPSSAHRWIRCPGAIQMTWKSSDQPTVFSQEGVQAHELAELCLKKKLSPFDPFLGDGSQEMRLHVQDYLDFVKTQSFQKKLIVEETLNLAPLIPEVYGTPDVLILSEDEIHVIDFKYGAGEKVSAEKNEQLMLYALGAWLHFQKDYENKEPNFKWTIFQPRLKHKDSGSCDLKELMLFQKVVSEKVSEALSEKPTLNPGPIQCRWCPVKTFCHARAEKNLELAKSEFGEDSFVEAREISNESLAKILPWIPEIRRWSFDLEAEALKRLQQGNEIPGFKLTYGRSSRRWREDAAEKLKNDERFFELRLRTFKSLRENFGSELEYLISENTFKPEGRPKLVSSAEPGEEKSTPKEDFLKLGEES